MRVYKKQTFCILFLDFMGYCQNMHTKNEHVENYQAGTEYNHIFVLGLGWLGWVALVTISNENHPFSRSFKNEVYIFYVH